MFADEGPDYVRCHIKTDNSSRRKRLKHSQQQGIQGLPMVGLSHLSDIVAAQVHKHDVLCALLLVSQQLRLQRRIALWRLSTPPRSCQRPACKSVVRS